MFDKDDNAADEVFEILASSRRRLLVEYLLEHGGAAPLWQLSREIVADETGATPADVGSEATRRVYISLYQTHIPSLEEHAVVEYDPDEGMVSLDEPDAVVSTFEEDEKPRRQRLAILYLTLATTLGALVVVHLFQLLPVTAPLLAAGTALSAAILFTVVTIGYCRRRSILSKGRLTDTLPPW